MIKIHQNRSGLFLTSHFILYIYMSIQDYIEKLQTIQADLIDFIKNEENVEENYQNLVNYI